MLLTISKSGKRQRSGAGVYIFSLRDFSEHDFETTGSKRAQQEQRETIYTSAPVPSLFPFVSVRSPNPVFFRPYQVTSVRPPQKNPSHTHCNPPPLRL